MLNIRKYLARSVTGIVLAALAAVSARADGDTNRIAALQATFRCPIFEYLAAIHRALHKEAEQNRYLIAEISPGDHEYYVQCAFFDMDRQLHCEAASAYYDKRLEHYFTTDRVKALGALGYSTEAASMNYYFERPTPNLESLYGMAGIIVETLGRVFAMQPDKTLTYHTPLVKRLPRANTGNKYCTPQIS